MNSFKTIQHVNVCTMTSQSSLLWLPGTWPLPNKLWDTLKAKIYHKLSKGKGPFSVANVDPYTVSIIIISH